MHVLLIHQAYTALDEPGGTRHEEIARYLVEKGHHVTVVTSAVSYLTGSSGTKDRGFDGGKNSPPGIKVIRAYSPTGIHRSFFHRLMSFFTFTVTSFISALGVKQVDLVWGTSPPLFQGFSAWLVARLKRIPFLFEVRDLWPAFAVAVGVLKDPFLISVSQRLERFLYMHADCVLVNSPGFISHVKDGGANKVELIPNGSDLTMFDPEDQGIAFREANNLKRKFVVLYAGAHGLSNDLGVVLEAARNLNSDPAIHFVLLGDGKEKPALIQMAAEMKLTNVLFLPPIAKKQMGTALAGADVCIAILKPIELYKTTYPNKVFDYMAAGRPVILAIDGVIRKIIEGNQAGIFVHPGKPEEITAAVRKLKINADIRRKMGRAGRSIIKRSFDREILAGEFEKLIREMEINHHGKDPDR